MCGLKEDRILDSINTLTRQSTENRAAPRPVTDYLADNVSQQIVRLIFSYTAYVNATVWRK
jgi:UDP-N-acetylglucosamine 2-epimerase (non-hydrolysing)